MRRILATDLGIWPVARNIERVSDALLSSRESRASLANHLLLYDQIVIPTGNFQVLPVLRHLLGEGTFDDLVKSDIIVLARYQKWFSYIGNGGGLKFFETFSPDKGKAGNLFHAYFSPLDEAVDTALSLTTPVCNSDRTRSLRNLLLDKTVPVADCIEPNSFRDETYNDILGSPYLRNFLALRNEGRSLDRLRGMRSNAVEIYSPHAQNSKRKNPEVWSVLHAAFENFILGIASDVCANEITGDGNTLALLKAKGQRVGADLEGQNAFTKIQEISGIPNIGAAFASGDLSAAQILDLRESKHSKAFRDWFASHSSRAADQIVREYVGSIGKLSFIERLPIKTLRFATTTGAGAVDPATGVLGSAIDSFLLSKWFPGNSPRLFIKHAKSVSLKKRGNSSSILAPKMTGRDRNRLCSCGSGKKYKRCCGR